MPHPVRAEGLHPVSDSNSASASVPGPAEPLPVKVLVVGHGVGDRPGDRARVAEVGDARDARHGEADDVELRAGQADLLVDAGGLDVAVGVARDDRPAGGGALAGDEPAVAAGGAGPVGGEQADRVRTEMAYDLLAPELGREPGEEDVRGEPDAERGPGLPAAGGETDGRELGGAAGAFGQALVDPVDVRPDPGGRLGVPSLQGGEAASRRVVEPGLSREPVPAERVRAEERGRGAARPVPFDLQLPGAVVGGDQSLGVGEFTRVARAQMWDTPGITVDLDSHPVSPMWIRLGSPK